MHAQLIIATSNCTHFVGGMDMQQRASSVSTLATRSKLQRLGSQELWDLAQLHSQNGALLNVVRGVLYPRRTGLAASAVRWIDDQLVVLNASAPCAPAKPRWKIAALIAAAAIAISGGIAHGAGLSIWHEFIRPFLQIG